MFSLPGASSGPRYTEVFLGQNLDSQGAHFGQIEMIQERLNCFYLTFQIIDQALCQCPDHWKVENWPTSEAVIDWEAREILR